MFGAALALLMIGCGSPPELSGQVYDIWGQPLAGVTILMVGANQRQLTDADGRYHFERVAGEFTLKVGKEGYIQTSQRFIVSPDESQDGPDFHLYRKPEDTGFYVVGVSDYERVEPQTVVSVGNELMSYSGVRSAGRVESEGGDLELLFHTDLSYDEIMRLGLELHRMSWQGEALMPGPLGSQTEAVINLWITDGQEEVEIEPLGSRTDYLLTSKNQLEAGIYALQTQELLTPKDTEHFTRIPDALRVVFPFTVRR